MKTKVSGTGWLCILMPNGEWMPVCLLTPAQIREYDQVADAFQRAQAKVKL